MKQRLTPAFAFSIAVLGLACSSTDQPPDDQATGDHDHVGGDDGTDDGSPGDRDGDGDSGPAGDSSGPRPTAPDLHVIPSSAVTSTSVQLDWDHAGTAGCCTFNIYYGTPGAEPYPLHGNVTGPSVVSGLTPDTDYLFYVTAVGNGQESPPSSIRQAMTKPGTPANFRITAITDTTMALAWDEFVGAADVDVFRSQANVSVVDESSLGQELPGNATGTTFTGLTPQATYTFRIRVSRGPTLVGDLSAPISATTTATPTLAGFTPPHALPQPRVVLSGANFGSNVGDVTVRFEGGGAGQDVVATITDFIATEIRVIVPDTALSGPISVERAGYAKVTSATSFIRGDMMEFDQVFTGPGPGARMLSIQAISHFMSIWGRLDGELGMMRDETTTHAVLDYSGAMATGLACNGTIDGDTATNIGISSVQCVEQDCLAARQGTCNAIYVGNIYGTPTPPVVRRIGPPVVNQPAIGPTRLLACGNPTHALGCSSIEYSGSGSQTVAYTLGMVASAFGSTGATFPPGADFQYNAMRGRKTSNDVIIFGQGGLLIGSYPFTSFSLFDNGPTGASGGDCTYGSGSYCVVAAGAGGVRQGSGAVTSAMTFAQVPYLPNAVFYDAHCHSHQQCTAVGVYDPGLITQEGIVAQTKDGEHWFYRLVGPSALRVVSCVDIGTHACFIGDAEGGLWRGVEAL